MIGTSDRWQNPGAFSGLLGNTCMAHVGLRFAAAALGSNRNLIPNSDGIRNGVGRAGTCRCSSLPASAKPKSCVGFWIVGTRYPVLRERERDYNALASQQV